MAAITLQAHLATPARANPADFIEAFAGDDRYVVDYLIAEVLYLSTNTIKWYGSQIYGKLGVKKRAEAADRAHELGFLG